MSSAFFIEKPLKKKIDAIMTRSCWPNDSPTWRRSTATPRGPGTGRRLGGFPLGFPHSPSHPCPSSKKRSARFAVCWPSLPFPFHLGGRGTGQFYQALCSPPGCPTRCPALWTALTEDRSIAWSIGPQETGHQDCQGPRSGHPSHGHHRPYPGIFPGHPGPAPQDHRRHHPVPFCPSSCSTAPTPWSTKLYRSSGSPTSPGTERW
jgi:hypothetical protein